MLDDLRANRVGNTYAAKKKLYQRLLLLTHPDKGGSQKAFRNVQNAWERVRERYEDGEDHRRKSPPPPPRWASSPSSSSSSSSFKFPTFKKGLTAQPRRPAPPPLKKPIQKLGVRRPGLKTRVYDPKTDDFVYATSSLRPRGSR